MSTGATTNAAGSGDRSVSTPDSRYGLLDALRGFSAVWVLWCHSISGDYTHLDYSNRLFAAWARFMEAGYLGVPIFFLISGYGISWSVEHHPQSGWGFLKRRMARIYPAYWISMILILIEVFAIVSLGLGRHAALPSWQQVLSALPLAKIPNLPRLNPVYWTLGYEMHFYLLSALGIWLLRRRSFLVFDLFTIAVLAERYTLFPVGSLDEFFVLRYYWLDFYCGNLVYRFLRASPRWPRAAFPSMALAALAVLNWPLAPRLRIASIVAVGLLLLHPVDPFLCRTRVISFFQLLGRWSYSLFLTNVMVGPKLIGFLNRATPMGNALYLLALAFGTAGSIAWAFAFYRWVEHPLADLAQRWSAHAPSGLGRNPALQLEGGHD
jgi:peptidoglycan/LPS O-acetylase OafA/YrhL